METKKGETLVTFRRKNSVSPNVLHLEFAPRIFNDDGHAFLLEFFDVLLFYKQQCCSRFAIILDQSQFPAENERSLLAE